MFYFEPAQSKTVNHIYQYKLLELGRVIYLQMSDLLVYV